MISSISLDSISSLLVRWAASAMPRWTFLPQTVYSDRLLYSNLVESTHLIGFSWIRFLQPDGSHVRPSAIEGFVFNLVDLCIATCHWIAPFSMGFDWNGSIHRRFFSFPTSVIRDQRWNILQPRYYDLYPPKPMIRRCSVTINVKLKNFRNKFSTKTGSWDRK